MLNKVSLPKVLYISVLRECSFWIQMDIFYVYFWIFQSSNARCTCTLSEICSNYVVIPDSSYISSARRFSNSSNRPDDLLATLSWQRNPKFPCTLRGTGNVRMVSQGACG